MLLFVTLYSKEVIKEFFGILINTNGKKGKIGI